MKILLINTYYPYPYSKNEYTYNRIWPPLSLANCAALLEKEGYRVEILDAHALRIRPTAIGKHIKNYDKVFISSSSLDKWQCPNVDISKFLETARHIREFTAEVYVMGYHGTVEPEMILDLTKAKAVIRGEPEYTVVEICQVNDLSKIKGIAFKDNGKIISTPPREPFDLKNLPPPAFHLLDFKNYYYEILGRGFALFETSRGCRYRCKFCNKVMYGEGIRTKSTEQILEEVTQAVEKYNVRTGYFIDLDFLSNREIAEELCTYLAAKKYKFKWACQTRPDLLDAEILKRMKRAGCSIIHLGLETGSQRLLDFINKDITIGELEKAVDLCNKAGIKTMIFILFGLPGETKQDRIATLDFARKLNADFASFHKVVAYKGSELFINKVEPDLNLDKFIHKAYCCYYLR
nr:hypothetical protein [Nanoarchaeum sp.]